MNHFSPEGIRDQIATDGYAIIPGILTEPYISRARKALHEAIEKESDYHGTTNYSDYGMVLLCSLYDRVFVDLFENPRFNEPFNSVMGNGCIVYAYTSSSMPPQQVNYSGRIHVDSPRLVPGYLTNMGATILLDNFTEVNGATWFLPKSHTHSEKPEEGEFYRRAHRLIAPAGSAVFMMR